MTSPYFSIVMPTRNRPELLQYSVRSALEQYFDASEFEVVVSDNSSDDRTERVVQEIDAPNLRYARTDADLSMPDSWEFAAKQARGRYVTFLCDDDARPPSSLAKLADILEESPALEMVTWAHATYFHPDWPESWNRNHLVFPSFSGEIVEEASESALRRMFRFDVAGLPKMLNSVCSREVIERVERGAGRLFLPTSPDYTFMAASLAVTRFFVYADTPIHLGGASKHSIGLSSMRGGSVATRAFYSEFGVGPEELHPAAPLCPAATCSAIWQSFVNVSLSGIIAADYEPDLPRYYSILYSELRNWEANGVGVDAMMRSLNNELSSKSEGWARDLQSRMCADIRKRRLRRWLGAHERLSMWERQLRAGLADKDERDFDGAKYGFSNILEGARRLENLISLRAGASGHRGLARSAWDFIRRR